MTTVSCLDLFAEGPHGPLRDLGSVLLGWLTAALPRRDEESPAPRDVDQRLVEDAQKGDRAAFEALYRRHVDLVWRRLTRLIGPDPDREDLTQQIFMDVFGGLGRFRGDAAFTTFLHRVVVNTAYDHLRGRGRRPSPVPADVLDEAQAVGATPEETAQHRQQLAWTWAALQRIKPDKRIAFILRVIEDLPLEDVATLVGASVTTVAKRVQGAHDELQDKLARHGRRREGEVIS